MKSIVFFNNKGGVGKTTLSTNVASYIALKKDKKVLYVDADPQCNSTQLFYSDEECSEILSDSGNLSSKTLYHFLKPVMLGENTIDKQKKPLISSTNKYGLDVIPCHPKMSLLEDRLSDAWFRSKGGDPGGIKITNWCTQLLGNFEESYDYVIFDVGPSLGALNRSILLSADFLVVPMGCDIFSVMGLNNIAEWVNNWVSQYENSLKLLKKDVDDISSFEIIANLDDRFQLGGYSVQQYYTKVIDGERRPIKAYDKIMQDIPTKIIDTLGFLVPSSIEKESLELAHIPYLFSLPPISQSSKTPIFNLTGSDGIVGAQYKHVTKYGEMLEEFVKRLLLNISQGK